MTPTRIRQLTSQVSGEATFVSLKNTHARHRADTISPLAKIWGTAPGSQHSRPRQAAVVVVGAGMLLGSAVPAQAGAISSAPAADVTAVQTWSAQAGSSYTVQSGDTLGQIAAQHGIDLSALLSLNGLSLESVIYPGDRINLTASAAGPAAAPAAAPRLMTLAGSIGSAGESSSAVPDTSREESASSSTNQAILAAARAQLGAVQDCTVLGEVALRAAGISGVGDESPESLMAYATPVSNPQPGDFIYYADGGMGFSHNAVYIGNGQAIHSGWNGNQTVIESVDVGSGPVYYRVNA